MAIILELTVKCDFQAIEFNGRNADEIADFISASVTVHFHPYGDGVTTLHFRLSDSAHEICVKEGYYLVRDRFGEVEVWSYSAFMEHFYNIQETE